MGVAVKRKRAAGPEGHRDNATRAIQREEAYRRHVLGGESLRSIANDFELAVSVVHNDVAEYQKMLRQELPKSFEQWQMRLMAEYTQLRDEADELIRHEQSGFVRVQALKLKVELTNKIEQLFGVNKAVKAPVPDEAEQDDEVVWG